ncbi:MAG TPA: PfkB family carbohydrate kinase [Cytophagaceae bacterium]|jgi:tagatose 6-phosphate kinase|nr:PfkB family carbohydrate kinase [Cytophagaceae bacterium]
MSKAYNTKGKYMLVVCPNPSVDILASVKNFIEGDSNRIVKESHFPGGKGVHVALAAAEMGEEVILLGFWGGPTGAWIKQECQKYSNLTCVGPIVNQWSRSCYTFSSEGKFNDTELLGVGPVLSENETNAFYECFELLLDEAKCVCMSGSWPQGAPADGYARLIGQANAHSKATFLDCTGIQFENAVRSNPFMVHLNKSEATAIFKTENVKDAAAKLAKFTTYAAVTDGAKGLYLSKGENFVHASCKIDKVLSAVGSGDCLTAGIAVGFVRKYDIRKMAKLGAACGSANCMREDLGLLYETDVENLFRQATISEVVLDYSN